MPGADAALIDALPKLEIIANSGSHVDRVDLAAARRRGIKSLFTVHNIHTRQVTLAQIEETGIDARHPNCCLQDWELENVYDIYPAWRWRYAPEVSRNTERVFGLWVPQRIPVVLSPREHTDAQWLPWHAAADQCFSPSNAEAILMLPRFVPTAPR